MSKQCKEGCHWCWADGIIDAEAPRTPNASPSATSVAPSHQERAERWIVEGLEVDISLGAEEPYFGNSVASLAREFAVVHEEALEHFQATIERERQAARAEEREACAERFRRFYASLDEQCLCSFSDGLDRALAALRSGEASDPLDVECPHCLAEPGLICVGRVHHAQRRESASPPLVIDVRGVPELVAAVNHRVNSFREVIEAARELEPLLPKEIGDGEHSAGAPDPDVLPLALALRAALSKCPIESCECCEASASLNVACVAYENELVALRLVAEAAARLAPLLPTEMRDGHDGKATDPMILPVALALRAALKEAGR